MAEPAMFGEPYLVRPRLGQGSFRVLVTDTYGRRCAVTGEKALPVLDAAHIRAVREGGQHRRYYPPAMRSPSPELVALAGPNGAGKSTVGPALLRESLGISIFVNADVIAQGLSGLEPEGAAFEAGRIMLERLDDLARRRASFAFETTLSGRAYARRISAMLQDGYRFHVVFLWLDNPELAVARVEDRVRAGGHAIPEGVVRRRYRAGLRNFFELYRPLTSSWQVYDNSSGYTDAPRLVARGRGKTTDSVVDRRTWTRVEGSF